MHAVVHVVVLIRLGYGDRLGGGGGGLLGVVGSRGFRLVVGELLVGGCGGLGFGGHRTGMIINKDVSHIQVRLAGGAAVQSASSRVHEAHAQQQSPHRQQVQQVPDKAGELPEQNEGEAGQEADEHQRRRRDFSQAAEGPDRAREGHPLLLRDALLHAGDRGCFVRRLENNDHEQRRQREEHHEAESGGPRPGRADAVHRADDRGREAPEADSRRRHQRDLRDDRDGPAPHRPADGERKKTAALFGESER